MGQVDVLVGHLWFGLRKYPTKMPNLSIFFPLGQKKSHQVRSKSTRVKDGSASYLLLDKSMVQSGHGPSLARRLYGIDPFILGGNPPDFVLMR